MRSHFHTLISVSLLFMSLPISAQWIDATGHATIVNGNTSKAREEAINQAISYASLQQGVTFTSQQTMAQGNLTSDNFSMDQTSHAQNVQLISEQVHGNKIIVNLRLELLDDAEQECRVSQLKAAILVTQALLKDRSQLRYGQLADFEETISERLGNLLNNQSRTSFAHLHANERLDIQQELIDVRGYRLPSWLSEATDSQYILLPRIIDISTSPPQTGFLGLWSEFPTRQFQIQFSLFHGISGEEIWQKTYTNEAPWEFELQETVAPNSERFWQSAYGRNIDNTLRKASQDLDSALICRPLLGQVVSRQHDRIILNLGRKHGIHTGDKIQLVLQENVPDRLNEMRPIATKSRATVTIEHVSEESATAMLLGENAALNVQINDIALKI